MMDNVLQKVLVDDPFIEERHHQTKPIYAALVPDEIFKGSHFERRFVTPFGNIWEQVAVAAAQAAGKKAICGTRIEGTIAQESLRRIQETLNVLEYGGEKDGSRRKWIEQLKYVRDGGGGELLSFTVVADVLVSKGQSLPQAFELKAPLPNSDQTKVSKEKILKLLAASPPVVSGAYYALPYNPYGKRADYAWPHPKRWFNMTEDEVVLIGEEFWDLVGGEGTYEKFVDAVNELGSRYKDVIYRDFLLIEPPSTKSEFKLR